MGITMIDQSLLHHQQQRSIIATVIVDHHRLSLQPTALKNVHCCTPFSFQFYMRFANVCFSKSRLLGP